MKIEYKIMNNYKNQKVPSIVLMLENKNYIFNTPQGYQRFLKEFNEKLKKNSFIFYTNNNPDNFLGILGLICTMIESKTTDDVYFYLIENIFNFIFGLEIIFNLRYLYFSFLNIKTKECLDGIKYNILHEKIKNTSNKLFREHYANIDNKFKFSCNNYVKNKSKHIKKDLIEEDITLIIDSNLEIFTIPLTNEIKCYILITNKIEGKMDKNAIKKFDLKGSEIKEIIKNNHIFKNDKKICISQIKKDPEMPQVNILLEAYNVLDIEKLKNNKIYNFILNNKENFNLNNFFHLSSKVNKEFYKKFLIETSEDFNKNILCNAKYEIYGWNNYFSKCDAFLKNLSKHFNMFFPIIDDLKYKEKFIDEFKNSNKYEFNIKDLTYDKIINKNNIFLDNIPLKNKFEFKYPFFNLLGTGSMYPSTYRNTSSILIAINENCNILLDCGEGSIIQLYKQYGKYADVIISKIKIITISHIHSDHNLGIFEILKYREDILLKNNKNIDDLIVILPYNCINLIYKFNEFIYKSKICYITTPDLMNYNKIEITEYLKKQMEFSGTFTNFGYDYKKEINNYEKSKLKYFEYYNKICKDNGIKKIIPINNNHCPESISFIIETTNYKYCYSGDTRPNEEFINFGKNCDILFHEATLEDKMYKEAISREHSTFREAIDVGKNMNCKYICLTHFSQRYNFSEKIKYMTNRISLNYKENNIIYGLDFWNFNFENIDILLENIKKINIGIFNFLK